MPFLVSLSTPAIHKTSTPITLFGQEPEKERPYFSSRAQSISSLREFSYEPDLTVVVYVLTRQPVIRYTAASVRPVFVIR